MRQTEIRINVVGNRANESLARGRNAGKVRRVPKRTYPLERGGPRELEIEWSANYAETTFRWRGRLVATVKYDALAQGVTIPLDDGASITAAFPSTRRAFSRPKHLSLRNDRGEPLPGSIDDPIAAARQASDLLYIVAAISAFVCSLSLVAGQHDMGSRIGDPIGMGLAAVVTTACGFLTRRGSRVALAIGIAFYALDLIAAVALSLFRGGFPSALGTLFRLMVLALLWDFYRRMRNGTKHPPTDSATR